MHLEIYYRKQKINVEMLTKDKLIELLYVAFNRRKAIKARFQDLIENENFSSIQQGKRMKEKLELMKKVLAEEKGRKNQITGWRKHEVVRKEKKKEKEKK